MMAYLDDLGKQFTDLDMKYERFSAVGREQFLHNEITKCIKAHYKIQQWVYYIIIVFHSK